MKEIKIKLFIGIFDVLLFLPTYLVMILVTRYSMIPSENLEVIRLIINSISNKWAAAATVTLPNLALDSLGFRIRGI